MILSTTTGPSYLPYAKYPSLGLRYPLAIYRTTHNETYRSQTRTAINLLSKSHRSIAGTIIADESITDLSPVHGSELCISAELMFSLSYIYQFLGDNDLADWAERTAFNAFPVSVSPDWWSHQYIQQENQVCNPSIYKET